MLLEMLRDGRLHLSGIARLAPYLTRGNREALLARATHMSHRQIVELLAELDPKPNAPATIRKLPTRKATAVEAGAATPPEDDGRPDTELCAHRVGGSGGELRPAGVGASPVRAGASPVHAPRHRPAIEPVAPARFRVRFDVSAELRDKLERLRALTRSAVPDGDLARVIALAVTRELERLEARRFGKKRRPRKTPAATDTGPRPRAATDTRPRSRHIPAAVRRIVEERDDFGKEVMARHRRSARSVSEASVRIPSGRYPGRRRLRGSRSG
jgi:hypothetical protein